MMKFFYTLNTFLRPYRRILYKVINFISMLLIFLLGIGTGLILARNGVIDLEAIPWVKLLQLR